MLSSEFLRLRPVRQVDLDTLYANLNDLDHRGPYFPLGLQAEPAFRRTFETDGFWTDREGMVVMLNAEGNIVGEIACSSTSTRTTSPPSAWRRRRDTHAKG